MLGWNDELTELTPEKRKERERKEQEQHQKDIVRGRRVLRGALVIFVLLQIFIIVLDFLVISEEKQTGSYFIGGAIRVAVVTAAVCGLWRGRQRARVFLAVLLVLGMISKGKEIVKLVLVRESPPVISWGIYEDTLELQDGSGTKSLFDYEDEREEAMAEYREWEKQRAAHRKRMIAAHLADMAVCAGYLYILYGCRPVKEFFDSREVNGANGKSPDGQFPDRRY